MSLVVTVTRIDLNNIDKIEEQRNYARKAVHHGLVDKEHYDNGNSPFHGDLIYSQMFDVGSKKEKHIYDNVSNSWKNDAKEAHVYIDLGFNAEMIKTISELQEHGLDIKFKTLSDKNMITRAVKSLKTVEDALSFFESQSDKLSFGSYRTGYISKPKNEYFEKREFNPQHYDKGEFKRIILESPFAGEVDRNVHYAKALIHKLAHEGYAPSASHLLYTQCLDDTKQFDRDLGINKGLDYAHNKDSIIGVDLGISGGMKYGIARAEKEGRSYRFDTLSIDPSVIKEVKSLRDLKDATTYFEEKSKINDHLFAQTGYITPNFLSDNILMSKNNMAPKSTKNKIIR